MEPASDKRVEIVDALRGLAAVAVCWCHFIGHVPLSPGILLELGTQGSLGVQVFFVLSGFVIPLSLARSNYSPHLFFRFLARRIVRLDPPYLASVLLVLIFVFLKARFVTSIGGRTPVDSPEQLFSHLAYATEVLGYQWLNPVYWTLAIEFQFYLLIGLIFPFVMHSSRLVRYGTLLLFLLCAQLPISHPGLILRFLPWFSLGILACYYRLGMSSVHELWVGAAAIAALFWRQWIPQETFVLLATCLALAFWRAPCGRPLAWLGSISYSLYLTHIVFGAGFLVLGQALHLPAWFNYPLVIAATAFSIVTAAGFHRVVEAPALRLASRITLRPGSAPKLHQPTPA